MDIFKTLLLAFLTLAASAFLLPALADNSDDKRRYAALAISEKGRSYGFSFNQSSKRKATAIAMRQCKKNASDCMIKILTTRCLAFAKAKGGGWGYAWSPKRSRAQAAAIYKCKKTSKNCAIEVSVCNR